MKKILRNTLTALLFIICLSILSAEKVHADEESYTLHYDLEGCTSGPEDQTGTEIKISSKVPKLFGYNFIGWSVSELRDSVDYIPYSSITLDDDLTLYPVWKEPKTYDGDLPSCIYDDDSELIQERYHNQIYIKLIPDVTAGYYFWSDTYTDELPVSVYDENGIRLIKKESEWVFGYDGGFLYFDVILEKGKTYFINMDRNEQLFIENKEICYNITYDLNGGYGNINPTVIQEGNEGTITYECPLYNGRSFEGWGLNPEDTEPSYLPADSIVPKRDMKLYAIWTDPQYIKPEVLDEEYVADNMRGEMARVYQFQPLVSGYYQIEARNEEYEDDLFYSYSTGAFARLYDADGKVLESSGDNEGSFCIYYYFTAGNMYYLNVNFNHYSDWPNALYHEYIDLYFYVKKEFSVTFDTNDGSGTTTSSKKFGNDPVDFPRTEPTRDGFDFDGWYTDPTAGTKVDRSTIITEDIVLFSHWKDNSISISEQPVDVIAADKDSVTFSILAEGNDLSYQWQYSTDQGKSWISSTASTAHSATLTTKVQSSYNDRLYRCKVTNASGTTVVSDMASMTVVNPVTITQQPVSKTVAINSPVTFKVTAEGTGLTFQWQYTEDNGTTWKKSTSGSANTSSLTVTAYKAYAERPYRCVITDITGKTVTSSRVSFSVDVKLLTIKKQPVSINAGTGERVEFKVVAYGYGLTYQWQYSADGGKTWYNSKAESAQTATLSTRTQSSFNGRLYRCIIKNSYGKTVTSNTVKLSVSTPIKITSRPSDQKATAGTQITFKVSATGSSLTYQWQYSKDDGKTWYNSTSSTAKTAEVTLKAAASNNGRLYRCVIKDNYGKTVISSAAKVVIQS